MKVGINLSINVSKIDKAKLFKGHQGVYLDATVFVDLDSYDKYGQSGMITQALKKGEKEQGIKGNILGNAKVFWKEGSQSPMPNPQNNEPAKVQGAHVPDEIPF